MVKVSLPTGLQSHIVCQDFNQSIEKVSLSTCLQSLTVCQDFSQSIEKVSLPTALQSITSGVSLNQNMEKVSLPIGPQSIIVCRMPRLVYLASWLLRACTSEPAPSASSLSLLCRVVSWSLVCVRAPWLQLTWMSEVVRIFEAQITCCRLKHKGRNQRDQESLVLPLFGVWSQLKRKALYVLMCNQRDKIFPKRLQFVKR